MKPPGLKSTLSPAGMSSTSSLMKVETFLLERTLHNHFLTPNTASGTCIFMSCFTVTWQDRRSTIYYDIYAQRVDRFGNWGYPALRRGAEQSAAKGP